MLTSKSFCFFKFFYLNYGSHSCLFKCLVTFIVYIEHYGDKLHNLFFLGNTLSFFSSRQ